MKVQSFIQAGNLTISKASVNIKKLMDGLKAETKFLKGVIFSSQQKISKHPLYTFRVVHL